MHGFEWTLSLSDMLLRTIYIFPTDGIQHQKGALKGKYTNLVVFKVYFGKEKRWFLKSLHWMWQGPTDIMNILTPGMPEIKLLSHSC